jgi:hypothetical protein
MGENSELASFRGPWRSMSGRISTARVLSKSQIAMLQHPESLYNWCNFAIAMVAESGKADRFGGVLINSSTWSSDVAMTDLKLDSSRDPGLTMTRAANRIRSSTSWRHTQVYHLHKNVHSQSAILDALHQTCCLAYSQDTT